MYDQILNTTSVQVLKKLQDYTVLKQKVIANNIANVETPGFRAKDVSFKDEFAKALRDGEFEKAFSLEPKVYERNDISVRNDGNNVDIEKEMIELQKNRMKYEVYVELLKNRFKLVKDLFAELKS